MLFEQKPGPVLSYLGRKPQESKQRKVNHGLQRATSGLIKILLILVQLNLRMWNSNLLALEK